MFFIVFSKIWLWICQNNNNRYMGIVYFKGVTVRVNIGSVSTFPKSILRQGSRPSNIIDGHFPGVLRWFSLTLVLLRCSTLKQGQISSFNVMKFIFLKLFKWDLNISACVIDRKLKFWGKLRQRFICIS